ncbi:MAG: hypothetical protein A3G33_05090 [Omnitrophica bacterium RIFCSPLOWO2_12_FULL_44_17]|uniref:Glycine-zipper-containing OmpA-like membrane domain-containing protein n=1 Tax=Candidatus Danuiimicrobium aquiferis TaxID=1801832 RepID=A0A1G1KXA9_9BACT|nr:MAG: hypothetical protein A3B72_01460 [Omnitrophica bacterium RIFCSPHIGHO2_02_FULL_45_28]OGW89152.1 MAG: hypothetical protein A3E74_06255 [Omnitrophica bacterium RIFCSPHIGHO2_12_FULL_44_12]OGW97531.1 MAG: hypothetical protein A3G33_05090 [Omnitrophica bacterium RIFCSPLOWO2_12_FULL_44_17]OGX02084.1 MAG: hypothetical protein A3J12_06385 [Omnitrophica bacterium RIFCSPLOWO2_02_FULL_44_11]
MKKVILLPIWIWAIAQTVWADLEYPVIYPQNNQSLEQQSLDAGACRSWAVQSIGQDPNDLRARISILQSQADQPSPAMPAAGSAIEGIAKSTALGALNESLNAGAAHGAAMAGASAVLGHVDQVANQFANRAGGQNAQRREQQITDLKNRYDAYVRAFSACMSAKRYSVK